MRTEDERAAQEVITKRVDHPSDDQAVFFFCAVPDLLFQQFPADINDWAFNPPHMLDSPLFKASVSKREEKVWHVDQGLPNESFLHLHEHHLALLRPLD